MYSIHGEVDVVVSASLDSVNCNSINWKDQRNELICEADGDRALHKSLISVHGLADRCDHYLLHLLVLAIKTPFFVCNCVTYTDKFTSTSNESKQYGSHNYVFISPFPSTFSNFPPK